MEFRKISAVVIRGINPCVPTRSHYVNRKAFPLFTIVPKQVFHFSHVMCLNTCVKYAYLHDVKYVLFCARI